MILMWLLRIWGKNTIDQGVDGSAFGEVVLVCVYRIITRLGMMGCGCFLYIIKS